MNLQAPGWNSLIQAQPIDPLSIIAQCGLAGSGGIWKRSTTFLQSSWGTNSVGFTGAASLISLNTTDASTVAWAMQWALMTGMVDVGAAINSAVSKVGYAKAGQFWSNQFQVGFGATNYTDLQLSFRDNLATTGAFAGSASGAVPVYSFSGTHTGNEMLTLTIPKPGTYSLVLVMSNAGTYSTFEMEIVAL